MTHPARLFVLGAILIACGAGAETDHGYLRDLTWVSKEGVTVRALWLFRGGEVRHESEMLAAAPSGRRYVLTHVLDARTGFIRTRLTQDDSGWWIEMDTDLAMRRPGVSALIGAFDPANLPAGHQVTATVTTSRGVALAATRIPYDSGDEYQALAGRLSLKDVPAGITEDLEFFESVFTPENEYGFEFKPLVYVLRASLGGEEPLQALTVQASRPVRGTVITGAERLTFTSGFRSVADPTDPMPALPVH